MLTVQTRTVGSRKALVPDFGVPLPPEYTGGGRRLRLRDLIEAVVRHEVIAFRARQDQRQLVWALTAEEIADGAARGKVSMGGSDTRQAVDEDRAVGVAWQAFADGLYLVFLDGAPQEDLEAEVFPQPDSTLLFVRLVMLAGG